MDKQEYSMLIEGTLRHQNNIKIAKTKYGNIFYGRIINTNYFEDEQVIPTLVASDDISLILGKPRFPDSFTNNEYKIKLIDKNNCGLYSIEVLKDKVDENYREIIRQKLWEQIETKIDNEVYKWMETKQTKFKYNEKEKIAQFNQELIKFLDSFRDTTKMPTTFREQAETMIVEEKISHILRTTMEYCN